MNVQSRIMASPWLGAAAVATSTALLMLQIVLAQPHSQAKSTRISATIAAVFESATVALLSWVLITSIRRKAERRVGALCFGGGIGLCVVAAALSVATLVCLSSLKTPEVNGTGYLAGTAVLLVVSFPLQLLFLVTRFLADRVQQEERSSTPGMQEIIDRLSPSRVKTVPYSSTSPACESRVSSRAPSMESKAGSSVGFSARSTMYSMSSTMENVVRSASSKTRLLPSNRSSRSQRSQRSTRRPPSMESFHHQQHRERTSALTDDSFDSWDTSAVDPQNRQLVIETTSPTTGCSRFLETIPASPTTSRSPSPGTPLDRFELPRPAARRSRSFSPATSTRSALPLPAPPKRAFTQQASASESHIHPLFRSDSPTPPPMASAGTIVIAAPQAGQIISDRQSVRSLSRMRSGSLPAVSSPLTAKGSFESFWPSSPGAAYFSSSSINDRTFSGTSDESDETMLGELQEEGGEAPERKTTPPVPEYILNAGSQTSLHAMDMYAARKTPSRDGPRGPGLGALDASW